MSTSTAPSGLMGGHFQRTPILHGTATRSATGMETTTLVVESAGFRDTTWLGSTGYPHSEDMRVTERYHRVDVETILYDVTITDPKAYTQPIVGPHRKMKLRPNDSQAD